MHLHLYLSEVQQTNIARTTEICSGEIIAASADGLLRLACCLQVKIKKLIACNMIAIRSGRAAIQEQICKMMQNTTLINMLADLSQFRLGCSALWDASVYKVYKVWVYCEISCHRLLKKLKVLGTEAYVWLSHAICKPDKDAVYLSGTAWMDTLSSCIKGIAVSVLA